MATIFFSMTTELFFKYRSHGNAPFFFLLSTGRLFVRVGLDLLVLRSQRWSSSRSACTFVSMSKNASDSSSSVEGGLFRNEVLGGRWWWWWGGEHCNFFKSYFHGKYWDFFLFPWQPLGFFLFPWKIAKYFFMETKYFCFHGNQKKQFPWK